MPYLGDYLGHLLSEITIARMRADIEAVRVAELYAQHPLLRHMPIPHFRLPDVEIDVPVVVNDIEEMEVGDSINRLPTINDMRKAFDRAITSALSTERIKLSKTNQSKLKSALDEKVIGLSRPSEIAIDKNRVAIEFSRIAVKTLAGAIQSEKRDAFNETLKNTVRIEFFTLQKPQLRLNAFIATSEVREAGPSEVITHLRLKITEEAFEWTTIGSDDDKEDRLVIE